MIFVDTWGFKAFMDRKEAKHEEVARVLFDQWRQNRPVFTSDYVVDETITLISCRMDYAAMKQFILTLDEAIATGHVKMLRVTELVYEQAKALKLQYEDKLKISFTDCTSAILMRFYKLNDVVTEDQHFKWMGEGFNVLFV